MRRFFQIQWILGRFSEVVSCLGLKGGVAATTEDTAPESQRLSAKEGAEPESGRATEPQLRRCREDSLRYNAGNFLKGTSQDVSLLTLHRPKFCAECGHKIVRLHWLPWTSRKYCDECVPKFVKERLVQPAIILSALFLTGMMVGHAWKPSPPPLIIQRGITPVQNSDANSNVGPTASLVEEDAYTCGARTKKGTPCSRRVHGPVRCWQHKGLKPMIAQEKLRIKE
jgi:hypothetical protein